MRFRIVRFHTSDCSQKLDQWRLGREDRGTPDSAKNSPEEQVCGSNAWRVEATLQIHLLLSQSPVIGICPLVLQKLVLSVPFTTGGRGAGAADPIQGRSLRLRTELGVQASAAPKTRKPGQSAHAESAQGLRTNDPASYRAENPTNRKK